MKTKECPRCGRVLKSLGYARHMAMHRDADELLKPYGGTTMAMKGETVLLGATHPGTKLEVLRSAAGWYLGYLDSDGQPYTRESVYLPMESEAHKLLTFLRGYES